MSQERTQGGVDQRLIKALGHPLRDRILRVLNERVASPNQISKELGEPLGNVAYHVKILRECDAIELVRTAPVRGAVEHFYQASTIRYLDDAHWARLPVSVRRSIFGESLRQIWDHTATAAKTGGFDDPKAHVSWSPLELDEEAFDELAEKLGEVLDRTLELEAEVIQRRVTGSAGDEDLRRTEVVILHFDRPPLAE